MITHTYTEGEDGGRDRDRDVCVHVLSTDVYILQHI
jgi:hypothetical protein